ncbi:hypothetical protein AR438_11030 [Chryseobacterium aquaticum]|uniref:Uncharacterized protein n=1 Tax=Chryseobacterium aquaticum TaxID=452084 RepID=A0A0Q3SLI5_9FLAO|nr:hypothetical protein [Chryseobacterium aquaticum]KQK26106.1 hypothetical protein AR438_11030 [Chryseobacterium aquaticum]
MNSSNIIVSEYLSSLKEDTELDHLFPILLNVMGFRIIQTAKESKGQSQYGKDIIAVGKDEKGIMHRWYFELKGYSDRDITQSNFSKSDGIRESIIEAKDTVFRDSSVSGFNHLPVKIIIVHNGTLKTNIRDTFEGFISREFKEGEFERWDIYHLTDLFSKYLFDEYLLSDAESNRLLKKTLAFLDSPDSEFKEFKELVNIQFRTFEDIRSRAFKKLFATLNLLNSIIFHYSKENNYLVPAKECSKFLVLKTWHWILENNLQNKKAVVTEFRKILQGQFEIFGEYFQGTFPIARTENGLYSEFGGFFEKVGYPLRSFEYLDDVIYYCRLRNTLYKSKNRIAIHNKQKDLIIELINNNNGFKRPLCDNHSIPIVQLLLFFSDKESLRQKDVEFLFSYIDQTVNNIHLEKIKFDRLPELHNNIDLIIEFIATKSRPEAYCDSSSILLAILLEICTVFNSKELFKKILSFIDDTLSLQIVSIDFSNAEVEKMLFDKHLYNEYYVECIERVQDGLTLLKAEADFTKFKKSVLDKKEPLTLYETDALGLSCVRYLAHSYFKNEILPEEWRALIRDQAPQEI